MTRRTRQRTALLARLLAVWLVLFLGCQGMALAAGLSVPTVNTGKAMAGMSNCHQAAKAVTGSEKSCHTDCSHIEKAFDNSGTVAVWAVTPQPTWVAATPATRIVTQFPPHDPIVDPPPTLRLHRFLE
ncbi:MAG TPA: hypothetical protein PLF22_12935 [Pseudomonadales bacterium]|nr:hypothetical protein [Pseudomonadales bacterium]